MDLAKITVGIWGGLSVDVASAHGLTPNHYFDEVAIPAIAIIAAIALFKSLGKVSQLVKVWLLCASMA